MSTTITNPTLARFEHEPPTPNMPADRQPVIGMIGMGEMGKMYARVLAGAGWKRFVSFHTNLLLVLTRRACRIHVCDLPQNEAKLREEMKGALSVDVDRRPRFGRCG